MLVNCYTWSQEQEKNWNKARAGEIWKQFHHQTWATPLLLVQESPYINYCNPFHCFEDDRKFLPWIMISVSSSACCIFWVHGRYNMGVKNGNNLTWRSYTFFCLLKTSVNERNYNGAWTSETCEWRILQPEAKRNIKSQHKVESETRNETRLDHGFLLSKSRCFLRKSKPAGLTICKNSLQWLQGSMVPCCYITKNNLTIFFDGKVQQKYGS